MDVLTNKIHRHQLKPGDHIYTWRGVYIYTHHGIFIGDEMVINFTGGAGSASLSSVPASSSVRTACSRCGGQNRPGVIASCLDCFLSGGVLCLFKYDVSWIFFLAQVEGGTCTMAKSDPPHQVLHRALFLQRNGFRSYNLFTNNCEDFAIYCKTELLVPYGSSGQVASSVCTVGTVAFGLFGLPVVGCGVVYCASRLASDITNRPGAVKVPVERL